MKAFYDVQNQVFEKKHGKWDQKKEAELVTAKSQINKSGELMFSEFSDIRIVCQLLLDFFETFEQAVISDHTISFVWEIMEFCKKQQRLEETASPEAEGEEEDRTRPPSANATENILMP